MLSVSIKKWKKTINMKFKFFNDIKNDEPDVPYFLDENGNYIGPVYTRYYDNMYISIKEKVFTIIARFDYSYESMNEETLRTFKHDLLQKLFYAIPPDVCNEGLNEINYDIIFQDDNSFTYRVEVIM